MYKHARFMACIALARARTLKPSLPRLIIPKATISVDRQLSTSDRPPLAFRAGDWICPNCKLHNKAERSLCMECETPATQGRVVGCGDWLCPACGCYNFQARMSCISCQELREDVKESLRASGRTSTQI